MEEIQYPKQALDKFRQWHFWWLVVFSLFLIVTFVYYLPTRFISEQSLNHDAMMEDEHMDDMHEEMDDHPHDGTESSDHEHEDGIEDEHMMEEDEMMMDDHDDHSTTAYHERSDIKNGLVVSFNASPEPS